MRRRLPAALRERDYARLVAAIIAMGFAREMVLVAVGWQVYNIDRNPLHLGLVGLAEFLPLPLLALPAGAIADRLSRKLVFIASLVFDASITALLILVSLRGANSLWPFLALAFASGVAAALGNPAARSMPPTLVPRELLTSALGDPFDRRPGDRGDRAGAWRVALRDQPGARLRDRASRSSWWRSSSFRRSGRGRWSRSRSWWADRVSAPCSRAYGSFAGRPCCSARSRSISSPSSSVAPSRCCPCSRVMSSKSGPVGAGVLRSAPAVGALAAGIMLTRRPLGGAAGRKLLVVVGVFGASMVVFGLSHSFALSFGALAVSGFADMISMNIRATITALATPDMLRGRVNAVEMVFISASNELGAVRVRGRAALVGAVPAVVIGGT
jgi:MFS family permease